MDNRDTYKEVLPFFTNIKFKIIASKNSEPTLYIITRFNSFELKTKCDIELLNYEIYNVYLYIGNNGLICKYRPTYLKKDYIYIIEEGECETEWCINLQRILVKIKKNILIN